MSKPLVSIVIPSYNHGRYIQQCIMSIIAQDYQNIELIIIDDGSQDDSVEKVMALESECKARFRRFVFHQRPNKGLCGTLNDAIDICQGEYYSAIASDDALLAHKVSKQVEYLQTHPACAAVFGGMNVVDDDGTVIHIRSKKAGSYNFNDIFHVKHSFAAPTQMIRMDVIREVGLYDEDIFIEDWYMWLKISAAGYVLDEIGEILCLYRRHLSNMSNQIERMDSARKDIIEKYRDRDGYNKAVALSKLSSAIDMQLMNRGKSVIFAFQSLKLSPTIIFDKRFHRYILKFFVPMSYLHKRHGVKPGE